MRDSTELLWLTVSGALERIALRLRVVCCEAHENTAVDLEGKSRASGLNHGTIFPLHADDVINYLYRHLSLNH